jgi:DNA modification methylase
MAAEKNAFERYPVVVARGWSEEKKRAYRIKDNSLALLSTWSTDLLRVELTELSNAGYDMPLLGFAGAQLVSFMSMPSGADPERTPDLPKKPASRLGDLWVMGKHRILCGDSTNADDVAKVLADHKPNLTVTDPPYGVNYDPMWREGLGRDVDGKAQRVTSGKTVNQFRANATGLVKNDDRADWRAAWELFPGDVIYAWSASLHSGVVQFSLEAANFFARAQIIWNKQTMVFGRGDYHWKHEPCWYAVRKGATAKWAGDRKQTTVWDIQNHNPMGGNRDEEQTGHGTQKPIECMKRPIENSSKPGDYVYEPFAGSGTTIIAAAMTNRYCLAIELDPAYVDLIVNRWQDFAKGEATLEGDGRTFAEVAKARLKGSGKAGGKKPAAPPSGRARSRASSPG